MNFIDTYLDYATPQTGAPRQYHFYAAYAILATVIGKRATYHGAGGPKGPNLWMVILGPSSMAYKSTVLNIAKRILHEFYDPQAVKWLLPASGSYESFVERINESPWGIIINDEFVSVMDLMKKDYNREYLGFLTGLYDFGEGVYIRRVGTRAKAVTYEIKDPFVNAIYCSTFEWFNSSIDEKLIMGGYIPRHILVHIDAPSAWIPETPLPDLALRDSLIEDLRHITSLPLGPMTYEPSAQKIYHDWYMEYMPRVTKDASPLLQPFIRRRVTDLHKFSMIHAIMRDSPREMNKTDLDSSIEITETLIDSSAQIISGKITLNPFQVNRQKVVELISRFQSSNGVEGAQRQHVLKYSRMKARDFDEIMQTLIGEGTVQENIGKNATGPKSVHYKLMEETQ